MKNKQNIKISQNVIFSPGSYALQVNPDLSLTLDLSMFYLCFIHIQIYCNYIRQLIQSLLLEFFIYFSMH